MQTAATRMLTLTTLIGPFRWARAPPLGAKTIMGMVKMLRVSPISHVSAPRSRSSTDHRASNIPIVR